MDENSATAALGWLLVQSPLFARALLAVISGELIDPHGLRADMQRHRSKDGGFTDIELRVGAECHAVIEARVAKVGPGTRCQIRQSDIFELCLQYLVGSCGLISNNPKE